MQMVAAALSGGVVDVGSRGREDPLPGPLPTGVRILSREGRGQLDPTGPGGQVALMQLLDGGDVADQVALDDGRQHRHSVLIALAGADDDLIAGEVDVLDPEAAALEHAQACSVEQAGHESGWAGEAVEERAHLVAREDHRESHGALGADDVVEPRQIDAEDVAVEEEKRAQRLVLVEAATWPSTARAVRKRVTSGAPSSAGCRLP